MAKGGRTHTGWRGRERYGQEEAVRRKVRRHSIHPVSLPHVSLPCLFESLFIYISRLFLASLSLSFSPSLSPLYVSLLLLCLSTFLHIYLSSYLPVVFALNLDFFGLNLWSPIDSFQYVCCISEKTSDMRQMLVWSPDSSQMAESQACSSRAALFHGIS